MFDPYHKWLGIPQDQRPPTHYQLLGISPKEKDREVIREAGIRQTAHLRTYQAGPQAVECTKLLNEIAQAQTVLLDPVKRKDYDAKLAKTAVTTKPKAASPQRRPVVKTPAGRAPQKKSSLGVGVLLGGAILLVAGGVAAFIYYKESRKPVEPPFVEGNKDQPQARDKDPGEVRPEVEAIIPPRLVAAPVDPKSDPRTYVQAGPRPDPGPELIRPPQVVVVTPPPPPDPARDPRTYVAKGLPIRKPEPGDKRASVPPAEEQVRAEKVIRELLKLDQVKRQPAEVAAAAQTLIDKAKETRDDPVARYVALRLGRDLALQAVEPAKAIEAVAELGRDYAIDEVDMKVSVLESLARVAVDLTKKQSVSQAALTVLDEAAAADSFPAARRLLKAIAPVIQSAGSRPLYDQLQARSKTVEWLSKEHEKVVRAEEVLAKSPADPDAHRIVGVYHCLQKGNWKKGLPHLARCGDAHLKDLANLESSAPQKAADQVSLGDGWYDLAKSQSEPARTQLHTRAYHWYALAVANLTGLTRDRVVKRLSELEKNPAVVASPSGPRLVPLPLEKVATCSSGRSMFTGDPAQVITFSKWGLQEHYGVPFLVADPKGGQVRNTIMLRGTGEGAVVAGEMPLSVRVPCNSQVKVLHLLSGSSGWGFPETKEKSLTMRIRLHFADGSPPEEHKLLNGVHFANLVTPTVEAGYKAIKAGNLYLRQLPIVVKRPHGLIKEIEFVKGEDVTAPLVMAMTVERPN